MRRNSDIVNDLNGEKQDLRNKLLNASDHEEYSHNYDLQDGDMDGLEQFKTSPRYVYPKSIEQNNPTLNPDFVKKIKNVETIGINESDEHDTPPR